MSANHRAADNPAPRCSENENTSSNRALTEKMRQLRRQFRADQLKPGAPAELDTCAVPPQFEEAADMRRNLAWAVLAVVPVGTLQAQPALTEPPEFPGSIPGPSAQPPGGGCFLLARGTITPGDVDWVRVTVPWSSSQTIFDVDFPTAGTTGSALMASVVGGSSGFNIADNNNLTRDAVCGLSGSSSPVGSTRDSAVTVGATARNAVVNVGVTGAEDTAFTGAHNQTFTYDLWVSTVPTACTSDAGCNDNVTCTVDRCNLSTGLCSNTPNDAACDNGRFCDGVETCNATLGCRPGSFPNCDDGVGCTFDRCNLSFDACEHLPDHDACDDGLPCNGLEVCDLQDGCEDGPPMDCDDGVACTNDACDDATGTCSHLAVDARCDDGRYCNGAETCDDQFGCQAGTPPTCDDAVPCTRDRCNGITDRCESAADDARCDDGRFCNGAEQCDVGLGCQPGTPPSCDDGVACTVDRCDATADRCENTPDDVRCDDGLFCDGVERCDAQLGCQSGTAMSCDDAVACTVDRCDERSRQCTHAADNTACDDGAFCNGQETCDVLHGCAPGVAPCDGDGCNENLNACVECAADADCDDGEFCNGAERCNEAGECVEGKAPCQDGETCDPVARECVVGGMTLDIQPRRCPNRLTGDEQFVNAAIVSVGGFDVREIRPKTLKLSRVDNMGNAVAPILDARDRRPTVEDVTSPVVGEPCDCAFARADGVKDLVIRFDGDETWKGLKLGRTRRGETVQVKLTGQLRDGTPFELNDCVTVGRGPGTN